MVATAAAQSKEKAFANIAGWGGRLAPLALFLLLSIALQIANNAYQNEFGGEPDEPAHFITGLMIRDYLASGFHQPPMSFAENYYLHYPKVAFGIWGPLLHVIEGVWMLIFSPGRTSVLVLMALITALTAFFLFRALKDETGILLALVAGAAFVAQPFVRYYTSMVMADGLVALLDFVAAMAFARYLTTENWKDATRFGCLATLSILTKGNGVALVFLPLFAMLFARRLDLLKRTSLWTAGLPLVLIALPWQFYSARLLAGILDRQPGWTFLLPDTVGVLTAIGVAFLPFVALGIYDRLVANRGAANAKWAAAGGLICAFWLFHWLVPSVGIGPRYLIAVMSPMLMFAAAGLQRAAQWILPGSSWRTGVSCAAMAGILALSGAAAPRLEHRGFDEVAELVEKPQFRHSAVLVSSEGLGEGMLISEIALHERRPTHLVLRASKMLAQSDWNGKHYILRYGSPADLMKFLNSIPVELVVIDKGPPLDGSGHFPHHALLERTIAEFSDQWSLLGKFPLEGGATSAIEVYRLKSAAGRSPGHTEIDMPYTLHHPIEQ